VLKEPQRKNSLANKVDDETTKTIDTGAYLPFRREIYIACLEEERLPDVDEMKVVIDPFRS